MEPAPPSADSSTVYGSGGLAERLARLVQTSPPPEAAAAPPALADTVGEAVRQADERSRARDEGLVEEIQGLAEGIGEELGSLRGALGALGAEIEGRVTAVGGDVGAAQQDLRDLREQVAQLRGELTGLEQRLGARIDEAVYALAETVLSAGLSPQAPVAPVRHGVEAASAVTAASIARRAAVTSAPATRNEKATLRPDRVVVYPASAVVRSRVPVLAWTRPLAHAPHSRACSVPSAQDTGSDARSGGPAGVAASARSHATCVAASTRSSRDRPLPSAIDPRPIPSPAAVARTTWAPAAVVPDPPAAAPTAFRSISA